MALGKQDLGPQGHMLDDELSEFLLIKHRLLIFLFLLNDLTLLNIKVHVVLGLPTIWPPQVHSDFIQGCIWIQVSSLQGLEEQSKPNLKVRLWFKS